MTRLFPWNKQYRKLWPIFAEIQKATVLPDGSPLKECGKNGWYGFHDFRRAFATLNAQQRDLFELQGLMQHKSLETTREYVAMASRLNQTVKNLFVPIFAASKQRQNALDGTKMERPETPPSTNDTTLIKNGGCAEAPVGVEPTMTDLQSVEHIAPNTVEKMTCDAVTKFSCTDSCTTCLGAESMDPGLAKVVAAWPKLPHFLKSAVLVLVQSGQEK